MEKKTTKDESFSTSMEKNISEYFTNEVGYDILELSHGFIMFTPFEDMFIVYELFLEKEHRGIENYKKIWDEIVEYCKSNDLKQVGGIVSLNKQNAMSIIMTHIRFGATIVGAQNNQIEFIRTI